jgi:hypothetical protein
LRDGVADDFQTGALVLLCVAAWAIPGAGHLWLGRARQRSGLPDRAPAHVRHRPGAFRRLFPFDFSQPLVVLQALADLGIGVPYFIANAIGAGAGNVRAVTYEYGNAYIIVAGLMNLLVVIDVYDVALAGSDDQPPPPPRRVRVLRLARVCRPGEGSPGRTITIRRTAVRRIRRRSRRDRLADVSLSALTCSGRPRPPEPRAGAAWLYGRLLRSTWP